LCDLFHAQGKRLRIHEDVAGGICIAGVTSHKVESQDEVRTMASGLVYNVDTLGTW
jgi:hypothetical protein